MERPILYKDIEVNERKFRINKFDARKGSFMLFKMLKILSPIFKTIDIKEIRDELKEDENKDEEKDIFGVINIEEIINSLCELTEEDFRYIQDNCLQVVVEILQSRNAPVLNKNGQYEVIGVEQDTGLIMNLTIQSLMFNVSGFFEGSPLGSILEGLNISQLNLKM